MTVLVELALAAWLLRSVVGKATRLATTAATFGRYKLIPIRAARFLVGFVVVLEIMLAVTLAAGLAGAFGLALVALVLITFGAVVAFDLLIGERHPCGCGSSGAADISWRLVARNVGIALAVGVVAWLAPPAPVPLGMRLLGAMVIAMGWGVLILVREFRSVQRLTANRGTHR